MIETPTDTSRTSATKTDPLSQRFATGWASPYVLFFPSSGVALVINISVLSTDVVRDPAGLLRCISWPLPQPVMIARLACHDWRLRTFP